MSGRPGTAGFLRPGGRAHIRPPGRRLLRAALSAACVAAVALAAGAAFAESPRDALDAGNRMFEQQKFEAALAAYREGLLRHPGVAELHQGAGNALYRLKRYAEAAREYEEASRGGTPGLRAAGHFNHGDAMVRSNQLPQSLESFRSSLRQNPEDADAKFNYELVKARLEQASQQQQNPGGGGGDKQQKKQPDKGGERPKPSEGNGPSGQKQSQSAKDPQQLNKEQAEQILKALATDEQRLQNERMKARVTERRLEKDW
ncbi:MAG: hypothetical protein HZB25_01490 [Candidatus Eisenbacteria bacterium]|nr:hypothetical protein [Candidatus Eisenbacteria bacterium]